MELGTRLVRRSGKIVELTAVEYDVLEKLLRAAGRIRPERAVARRPGKKPFSI